METLGDLHRQVIVAMDSVPTRGGSVKDYAFKVVRDALVEGAGLPPDLVKADAELETLFPLKYRRRLWCNFTHRLPWDSTVLYLHFPNGIRNLAIAGFMLAFLATVPAFISVFFAWSNIGIAFVVLGTVIALGIFLNSEPNNSLATRVSSWFKTPGDIADYFTRNMYGKLARECGNWNESEVWEIILQIADKTLENDPADLTPECKLSDLVEIYD